MKILYGNIIMMFHFKKNKYKDPNSLDSNNDPIYQDLNHSPYQKITELGYQNIWVQMRVRNHGVPDWPIIDGYPNGYLLKGDDPNNPNTLNKLLPNIPANYGYEIDFDKPPYFKNIYINDSNNNEYKYTIGTFTWGAPADKMSPVQPLTAYK